MVSNNSALKVSATLGFGLDRPETRWSSRTVPLRLAVMKHETDRAEVVSANEGDPAEVVSANEGDPACWAHLICPECGAIEIEGHRPACRYEQAEASGTDRASES